MFDNLYDAIKIEYGEDPLVGCEPDPRIIRGLCTLVRGAIRVSKKRPEAYKDNPGLEPSYGPRTSAVHAADHALFFAVACHGPVFNGDAVDEDGELHIFHCAMRLVLAIESTLIADKLAAETSEVTRQEG